MGVMMAGPGHCLPCAKAAGSSHCLPPLAMVMCAPKKKAKLQPVKKKGCAKVKLTQLDRNKFSEIEAVRKALRNTPNDHVLAESKKGKVGIKVVGCGLAHPTDKDGIAIGSDCAGLCSEGVVPGLRPEGDDLLFRCDPDDMSPRPRLTSMYLG